MSWYMSPWSLPNIGSPKLALRMLSSIILVKMLSNWRATSRSVSGSLASAPRRSAANCRKSVALTAPRRGPLTRARLFTGLRSMRRLSVTSDDDELGAQRAGFLERLENGHQVAGRGAHLVHGAHDVVEIDAGVEHEHARLGLVRP